MTKRLQELGNNGRGGIRGWMRKGEELDCWRVEGLEALRVEGLEG